MKSLPFPLRIAAGVLAIIIVIWLARWLGSASMLLAGVIWVSAALGVLHAGGRLDWIDRNPPLSRLFQAYAPRVAGAPAARRSVGVAGSSNEAAPSAVKTQPVIPDVSSFAGLDDVQNEIEVLVQSRTLLRNTVSPATVIFLVGPRGTGKTSLALRLAADLHKANVLKSDRIVTLSEDDVPGLSDSYGPSSESLTALSGRIQAALDGVLLVDDIDQLLSLAGQVAQEVGSRILGMARRFPGRLLVICTGSAEAFARLDPDRRWISQLNIRRLDFPSLSEPALQRIFVDLLASHGFQLAPDAVRPLGLRIRDIKQERGEKFDNAHAVRRFADAVLHDHTVRVRQAAGADATQRSVIAAEDVRNAFPAV